MSLEPEENPLDQSLREVFRDYDLPPAEHPHVWENVARQLHSPLANSASGLVRRLGLPALAALGLLAGGWLLLAPAALVTPEATASVGTRLPALAEPAAPVVSAPTASLPPANALAPAAAPQPRALLKRVPAKRRIVKAISPAQTVMPAEPAPAATPAADMFTHEGLIAAAGQQMPSPMESAPTQAMPQPPAVAPAEDPALLATVATSQPAKQVRYKDSDENGFKYHKPTHRLAEPGTGFQRWLGRLKKNVRQLVGKD